MNRPDIDQHKDEILRVLRDEGPLVVRGGCGGCLAAITELMSERRVDERKEGDHFVIALAPKESLH